MVKREIILWILVLISFLGVIAFMVLLIFSPPPAEFINASIITKTVKPISNPVVMIDSGIKKIDVGIVTPYTKPSQKPENTGMVRMNSTISSKIDPNCLVSTQFYIDMPDGSTWKLPGARLSGGHRKTADEAVYQAIVPWRSPPGVAYFYVNDTYSCGIHDQRVISPKLAFTILPSE